MAFSRTFFLICKLCWVALFFSVSFTILAKNSHNQVNVGFHRLVPTTLDRNDGLWTGSYRQIYECAFKQLSLPTDFQVMPIKRMIKSLEAGKIDVGNLLIQTKQRDKHSTFVGPFIQRPYMILTKKDKDTSGVKDWSTWTLGTVYGTNFHNVIKEHTQAKVETSSSWQSIVSMLHKDRVDGVVMVEEILQANISADLLKGLKTENINSIPLMNLGLYISKQSPLLNKLNQEFSYAKSECSEYFQFANKSADSL